MAHRTQEEAPTSRRARPGWRACVVVASACLLAALAPAALVSADTKSTGTIAGAVTDASTSDPIGDVCVYAFPAAGGGSAAGGRTSPATGDYSLKVAAGSYKLRFRPCSQRYYVTQFYDDEPTLATANPLAVIVGKTDKIDAKLSLGGEITGTLTDETSAAPLVGFCVHAELQSGGGIGTPKNGPDTELTSLWTHTAATGSYVFVGVPVGSYDLYFTDCHHHQYLPAGVNDITVNAGATAQQSDTMAIPGKITGTVTSNKTELSLARICVQLFVNGFDDAAGFTNKEGQFSFDKLSPGSYEVEFTDCLHHDYLQQYYSGKTASLTGTAITLEEGQTISGIDATMVIGGAFNGVVRTKGPDGVGIAHICVAAAPVEAPENVYQPGYVYAFTNSSGHYTMPGLYSWGYDVSFNVCVPNSQYGSTSWSGNPLNAFSGVTFSHLSVRLPKA
jgi:hypothetical protein